MQDATGQVICWQDLVSVRLEDSPAACPSRNKYGIVLKGLPGRKVVVQCVDGTVATENARDVRVADRSYLRPGMAVVSAADRASQLGVVTGAAVELDLVRLSSSDDDGGGESASPAVASPSELRRVRELGLGDYVVAGPWLGRVFEVSVDVDVVFDDGAACRVTRADGGGRLRPVTGDFLNRSTNSVFYPGQRVVAGGSSVFKASRWLEGYWKPSHGEGTVSRVETAGVLVHWVASSQLGTETALIQASAPPHQQSPRDLTFFRSGDNLLGFWGLGDRCFFRRRAPPPAAAGDVGAARGLTRTRRNHRRARRRRRRAAGGIERPMSVAGTRTTVDVLWQDGTRQRRVPSASLVEFVFHDTHEFFPGQRVVSKQTRVHGGGGGGGGSDDEDDATTTAPEDARVGVVRSLNFEDQTVRVSWLRSSTCTDDGDDETVLSTYDLGRNSDRNVFYGDVVVRRRPMATRDDDLSWVGHIVDFCDDDAHYYVQVEWGDGNTPKALLHEIAVIKEQRVDELLKEIGEWVYEDDGGLDNAIAPMAQDTVVSAIDNNNNSNDGEGDGDDSSSESDSDDSHTAMRRVDCVGAVVQAVIRLAGNVLAQGRYLLSGWTVAKVSTSELTATENTNVSRPKPAGDGDVDVVADIVNGDSGGGGGGSIREGKAEADATGDDESIHFSQFEIVQSPRDHHYLDNMEQGTGGGRKWMKRVQKEWKILENNLPDTIYIRAYEDRMDLLRAVMVGASGTPYHDGLFFFDLQLPPSYPAAPPLVSYRSFGLRVNPNLYPSGTVCLSLLNTFGGHGAELWSPEASSILQVIVSILGLILNAQPYYNEAGYAIQAGTPEGHRNELPYNENTYLLTLRTMLHLLRRPPAGFEDFITQHFLRRGRHVLLACKAYLEGCLVGTLDSEAYPTEASRERPCSVGFRLALANVVPRLVEASMRIGAEGCENFDHLGVPALGALSVTG